MTQADSPAVSAGKRPLLKSILSALKLIVVNFLIFAALVELVCLVYINVTNWPSSKPTYHVNYNSFFADINPSFGVWHRPSSHYYHQGGCFSVQYTTNSYGARDVERPIHSSQPRTIVLGDSMIEGLGLADNDRLTNILEKRTGQPYLNFGISGDFGPLQYALLYKTLASNFDHDTVLVAILAANDFRDMSLEWGKKYHAGRYRPYYADDFSIVYTGHVRPDAGEGFWDHTEAILRAYLASYHVGQFIWSRFYWRNIPSYSGYNDFTDVDTARLKTALSDIKSTAEAHHARMGVFIIPTANDFTRLHQSGSNRLGPLLLQWGKDTGIPVKDLLPEMEVRSAGNPRSYFLSCDGHWSPHGSEVASEVLQPWLSQFKADTK